ncbi:hypothetical protein [Gorillibacterium timonense]|uniref:hypothetical protein n=1 Tax=Gorillibacterium timonense TaxID=1689269 RepID=UPI00071DB6F1|nr:hypothetical protein [Gorillibacterium timonense]
MYKKLALGALILSLSISAAACSSDNKNAESASPTQSAAAATVAPTAAPAEDASLYQAKAYIAGRLAEEKINQLFTKETTEDGKPVLTSTIAKNKEEAAAFLNAYLDPALTEKVLAHYLTDEKAGEAIVVKADPFVTASILATASQDDVTFAGSADEVKMTLKDGGVYTAKKTAEGGYVISDIAK